MIRTKLWKLLKQSMKIVSNIKKGGNFMKEARIWRRGSKVVSKTPYNEEFINFAREQKAKWNSSEKTWIFADTDLESVKAEMEKYFDVVVGKIQLHDEGNLDRKSTRLNSSHAN